VGSESGISKNAMGRASAPIIPLIPPFYMQKYFEIFFMSFANFVQDHPLIDLKDSHIRLIKKWDQWDYGSV